MASRIKTLICFVAVTLVRPGSCRDEDRIMKACFWPYEVYEPCFGGCAEVTCDNPRNHLRPCYPYCEPGCVCEEPYVRDDRTHQCVLPQDCSPTQMGIPVPTRRNSKYNSNTINNNNINNNNNNNNNHNSNSNYNTNTHNSNLNYNTNRNNVNNYSPKRYYPKKEEEPFEGRENDGVQGSDPSHHAKFPADVSRMGNYFNIVIAPPPIRALLPRKTVQNDAHRTSPKRSM